METQRERLRKLSPERLIDTIEVLAQRINGLEKQVRELKKLLQLPSTPPVRVNKTPQNSSKPSGQSEKGQVVRRVKGKRGPKAGHQGQTSTADEIVDCRATVCSYCGETLVGLAQQEIGRRQVIDLPAFRYIVREARCYAVDCPACGQRQRGNYPVGFETGRTFSQRLEQVALYLHHAHPLSYQRLQHIFRDLYGLHLSVGALVNGVQGHAQVLHEAAEAIRQQVKQSAVVGSDETSMRVNGQNYWQWVFQTPQWVYMRIHRRRAGAVIHEVLADARPQVWVSDLGSMQLEHPAQSLQVCLAHQVRDLQFAIDTYRCGWAYRLQALLYRAIRLGKHRSHLAEAHFTTQTQIIHQELLTLLSQYPNNPVSQRLHARYTKHQGSLLVFLHRPDVPPTNNASEQALRNSVIYRKVTGGFRSTLGAQCYADLVSILESARPQQRNFFDTLSLVLAHQSVFAPLRE